MALTLRLQTVDEFHRLMRQAIKVTHDQLFLGYYDAGDKPTPTVALPARHNKRIRRLFDAHRLSDTITWSCEFSAPMGSPSGTHRYVFLTVQVFEPAATKFVLCWNLAVHRCFLEAAARDGLALAEDTAGADGRTAAVAVREYAIESLNHILTLQGVLEAVAP